MDKGKSTIDHIPSLAMSSLHPRDYEEGVLYDPHQYLV